MATAAVSVDVLVADTLVDLRRGEVGNRCGKAVAVLVDVIAWGAED